MLSHQVMLSQASVMEEDAHEGYSQDNKTEDGTVPDKIEHDVDIEACQHNANQLGQIWREVTSDNYLSLFGFRRYRTTHLLNLRLLEAEVHQIDHDLYQAGLHLDQPLGRGHRLDRLGLSGARRDDEPKPVEEVLNEASILRLRKVIKDYDEALSAFNTVMSMETFSLADNTSYSGCGQGLHASEKSKTRMLRVDLPLRHNSRDPLQHFIRKILRRLRHAINNRKLRMDDEERGRIESPSKIAATWDRTFQNTARIAEFVTRFIIAIMTGIALIVPLILILSFDSQEKRLLVVISCVSVFCLLLSFLSKASNYETMAASAAYAAVLTVLVSNGSVTQG